MFVFICIFIIQFLHSSLRKGNLYISNIDIYFTATLIGLRGNWSAQNSYKGKTAMFVHGAGHSNRADQGSFLLILSVRDLCILNLSLVLHRFATGIVLTTIRLSTSLRRRSITHIRSEGKNGFARFKGSKNLTICFRELLRKDLVVISTGSAEACSCYKILTFATSPILNLRMS